MSMIYEFYIVHPEDQQTRYYFHGIKQANELAQQLADNFNKTVVRYDIHGGQSWFRKAGN